MPLASPLWLLLLLLSCSFSAIQEAANLGGELTVEKELEMTAEIHRQIRSQVKFVNDPVILAYLNEIGQEIVRATEPQPYVYRFSLLEAEELNAFTIGGGYVYLSSAVLAQAGEVAEIAGVLGHEIAHVYERHVAKRQENQGLATLATLAATVAVMIAGGDPSLIAISEGINVSMQLKNSRANEAEADREGIAFVIRAGYDPSGITRFLQRILAEHPHAGADIPAYLYSHPAVRERIAASRVEIERSEISPELRRALRRRDGKLREVQARLTLVMERLAGGSGLHARAAFDRRSGDEFLERARREREAGGLDRAAAILAEGQTVNPNDPRLSLARADVAELQSDLEQARLALERAFELDPSVPLVQYRLGRIHKQLGNPSRAVFYLEQAATGFAPGSSGRRRAELEIEQLAFKTFEESGVGIESGDHRSIFSVGETVVWWGRLNRRFQTYNPEIEVRWLDPEGHLVRSERVRMSPLGSVSSMLPTSSLDPRSGGGDWRVRIKVADSIVEVREFHIRSRESQ